MIGISSAAQKVIGLHSAEFPSERKLRREFIDRVEGVNEIPQAKIAQGRADQVFIARIVNTDRAVKRQAVAESVGRESDLRPAAARSDGANAARNQRISLTISKFRVVTLKNSGLKTA